MAFGMFMVWLWLYLAIQGLRPTSLAIWLPELDCLCLLGELLSC